VADEYSNFGDERIKHLELIQAVVARLGNDGFLMKGGALTVAGAFNGFAIDKANWHLALASIFPTVTFWGLDAYFLRCERLFRCLYSKVRAKDQVIKPFFMGATGKWFTRLATGGDNDDDVDSWWRTGWSGTLLAFYGAIVLAVLAVITLIICHND
jgi:hypothetical protein